MRQEYYYIFKAIVASKIVRLQSSFFLLVIALCVTYLHNDLYNQRHHNHFCLRHHHHHLSHKLLLFSCKMKERMMKNIVCGMACVSFSYMPCLLLISCEPHHRINHNLIEILVSSVAVQKEIFLWKILKSKKSTRRDSLYIWLSELRERWWWWAVRLNWLETVPSEEAFTYVNVTCVLVFCYSSWLEKKTAQSTTIISSNIIISRHHIFSYISPLEISLLLLLSSKATDAIHQIFMCTVLTFYSLDKKRSSSIIARKKLKSFFLLSWYK